MIYLKPCPFCGETDIRIAHKTVDRTHRDGQRGTRTEKYRIYCPSCWGQTAWGYYLEDVTEAWNKRPNNG